jgi:RNA polymerase sigma factor (sigma-70 family)
MRTDDNKTSGKVGRRGLDQATVEAMRADYLRLKSLAEAGKLWGRTRQAMWDILKRRNATLGQKKHDEPVWYRGDKYTPAKDGYLRRTRRHGHGELHLQRVVWTDAHGPIPEGHQITFKDGDRTNCSLENLECLPVAEVVRRNHSGLNGAIKKRQHELALSMGPYIAGQSQRIACTFHVEASDLQQIGHLEAMKLALKYDSGRGAGFYGYTFRSIRNAMMRYAQRDAAALSGPLTKVSQIHAMSLDAPVGDDDGSATLGELVGRDEEVTGEAQRTETMALLTTALTRLKPRERTVIEARYMEGRSLQDIAEQLGITREGARQIEVRALAALRGLEIMKKLAA